ncbi:His-Xaa-Ser repeat protein HxsA2 [Rhodocyclus gracilis]|nr:His-Xaa-Ser repeat protein HxsA2 [Rhodocyclus gracilis]
MKKFSFLIPVAMAAAAMSGETSAMQKAAPTPSPEKPTTASREGSSDALGFTQSFYTQQDELHSLMVKPTGTGQMFAYHHSHASHASHASHYSHRSGY